MLFHVGKDFRPALGEDFAELLRHFLDPKCSALGFQLQPHVEPQAQCEMRLINQVGLFAQFNIKEGAVVEGTRSAVLTDAQLQDQNVRMELGIMRP